MPERIAPTAGAYSEYGVGSDSIDNCAIWFKISEEAFLGESFEKIESPKTQNQAATVANKLNIQLIEGQREKEKECLK